MVVQAEIKGVYHHAPHKFFTAPINDGFLGPCAWKEEDHLPA